MVFALVLLRGMELILALEDSARDASSTSANACVTRFDSAEMKIIDVEACSRSRYRSLPRAYQSKESAIRNVNCQVG